MFRSRGFSVRRKGLPDLGSSFSCEIFEWFVFGSIAPVSHQCLRFNKNLGSTHVPFWNRRNCQGKATFRRSIFVSVRSKGDLLLGYDSDGDWVSSRMLERWEHTDSSVFFFGVSLAKLKLRLCTVDF